ncbi:MAG: DUF4326 domain-containing protein [Patescibacteria group bacterium]|nr:DUF4326 domain-containing protein [Patescibacteria group bacterium]
MPERIQRKRTKGWKMPANTVYVGRGSKWGNPYKIGTILIPNAEAATQAFAANLPLGPFAQELRGKNLACWCPLPKAGEVDWCHAAVLLREANPELKD